MKIAALVLIITLFALSSCNQGAPVNGKGAVDTIAEKTQPPISRVGKPILSLGAITKSFSSFWSYFNQYAQLHQDYPTFDENNDAISKTKFLKAIQTAKYIPLVVFGKGDSLNFKLAAIPKQASKDIGAILNNYATRELDLYQLEGKPVPDFQLTALNGKVYTATNTKGKIVLFKCWFINCVQCVAEMPTLNELVESLKDRDDILFISLAMDEKDDLRKFLAKTKFAYATVPNQTKYMSEKLKVSLYPTHFLINKKGIMVKAVSNAQDLKIYLEKELQKI
jgi:peroxiredoxin